MPTTTTFRSFVVLATPFVVAFMLCSAALFAQTTNSVSTPLLNRDLPQTVREAKMHEAQTAANHLFSALQTNDEAAIFTLLPTREVYKAMIATHFYAHETERTKAYERLAKEYDGQVEQIDRKSVV